MHFLAALPLAIILLLVVVIFGIHFVPVVIAGNRHARNFWWIFALDFFFGWTVVGWVIALVWALRDDPRY